MNERIKEFELQAYVEVTRPWTDPQSNYVIEQTFKEFNRERFAELIVEECANIDFRHASNGEFSNYEASIIGELIRKHFK